MDEIINEFLVESFENLDQLDQDLVDLEQDPNNKDLLSSIFRIIHTIKGTCGFLGFSKLESLTHIGESLLSKLRDGKLALNPDIASALLAMVDAIRQILDRIESDRAEGDEEYANLKDTLSRLTNVETVSAGESSTPCSDPLEPDIPAAPDSTKATPAFETPSQKSGYDEYESEIDKGVQEVVNEFLVESYENLDQLYQDLVDLKQYPSNKEILSNIFRIIHTIKGTCGFLGFSKLEALTHVGENLLSKLRDGILTLSPEIANALLSMLDAVRQMLSSIESNKNQGSVDYSELIETLSKISQGESVSLPAAAPTSEEKPAVPAAVETAPISSPVIPALKEKAVPSVLANSDEKEVVYLEKYSDRQQEQKPLVSESSIRVDVGLLDQLMNLVGELVLARNQILQHSAVNSDKDTAFTATTQHLNLITTELQEGVMKTRMQPIGNVWSKFPRVVRDLSVSCKKKVRIEMEGKDTELDKTIIEAIKDPLTHIVRNSVDHGIELPDERVANGKPEEGELYLRAFHEGGQVIIEIKDDGGGINGERVKNKALEKGIITQDHANRMSEREMVNLIFAPGFSTAAQVSNISGRGVGMDVVKTNIEKIGGSVDIQSELGQGTTLKVKIPLTLAIIPALIVTCGANRFAIPQVSLLELVRLDENSARGIDMIDGTPVYRLRGNLLALVNLNKELGLKPTIENGDQAKFIVILQANDRQFGLVVEGIAGTEEIVVKPLGKQLKGISAFAGATIMGDGKVALILDVLGLAQNAHVVSETKGKKSLSEKSPVEARETTEAQKLLVFSVGDKGRMAINLNMVGRLEEFKRSAVEQSGNLDVVQYRGEIMPLIYLSRIFNSESQNGDSDMMQAVVYSENGRSVGLVVEQILDIVEESVTIQKNSELPGVLGTAVVKQRVTDLVDVPEVIRLSISGYYVEKSLAALEGGQKG